MTNAIYVYDVSYDASKVEQGQLVDFFKKHCKRWTFQKEEGDSGYIHYQGRFSLGTKLRMSDCIKLWQSEGLAQAHLSITSESEHKNDFYCRKEKGRLAGPWKDTDVDESKMPWDLEDIKELWPWQQIIWDSADKREKRIINVIIDETGDIGKSSVVRYLGFFKRGRKLPPVNSYKDIMRIVCDLPTSKLYMLDVPRAADIKNSSDLWAGIEELKSGYAWDDRYSFKEKYFDPPQVWVFMNKEPNLSYLSRDRWKIWMIKEQQLVPYEREPSIKRTKYSGMDELD